jgi:hypothetical protein
MCMTTIPAAEAVDGQRIAIIDGDTIDVRGERIRILNIDAPESFRSRCEAELKLALRTRVRLNKLFTKVAIDNPLLQSSCLRNIDIGGGGCMEFLRRE